MTLLDRRKSDESAEAASAVAVQALGHLAADPVLLKRFLDLTGLQPHEIRAASADPVFFADLLDFFLADERTLLAFAAEAGLSPERVASARRALGGPSGEAFA